jgi:hypothetical protein
MRTSYARQLCLALVAILTLVSTAAMAASDHPRPFGATIEGHANPVFTGPCSIVNDETGSGHALHLGAMTLTTHEDVDLCSNPAGAVINGQFVMTAANGDQIVGIYQTLGHLDFATNQITVAGTYMITGGTGRFVDASGQGNLTAVGNLLPPFEVTASFFGRIAY